MYPMHVIVLPEMCDSSCHSVIQSTFSHLLQTLFEAVARFAHGLFLDLKNGKIFISVKVKVRLFCIYSREEKPVETCSCVDFFVKAPRCLNWNWSSADWEEFYKCGRFLSL